MSAQGQFISIRQQRIKRAAGLLKLQGVLLLCLAAAAVVAQILEPMFMIVAVVFAGAAVCYFLLVRLLVGGYRWAPLPALVLVSLHWALVLLPTVNDLSTGGIAVHDLGQVLLALAWLTLLSVLIVRLAQCLAATPDHVAGFEPIVAAPPAPPAPMATESDAEGAGRG